MYVPSVHSLSPFLVVRAFLSKPSSHSRDRVYVSYARHGLHLLVDALAVQGIQELLVPAYICREALEQMGESQVRVQFYDIRPDLSPDLKEFSTLPAGPKALLLVHYFGFPNAVEEVARFCQQNGFFLIEDCAQALYSAQEGRALGAFGDAAFFSPRKFLPVPYGAYVVIHNQKLKKAVHEPTGKSPKIFLNLSRDLARWLMFKSGVHIGHFNPSSDLQPEDYPLAPLNCAPVMSKRMIRMMGWFERQNEIVGRRCHNYEMLLEKVAGLPLTVLFPKLQPDICPWVFPVMVSHRDEILTRLRQMGIGAQFWPTLPAKIMDNSQFPQANRFRTELLLLPIHQDLSTRHIDFIASCMAKVIRHEN